MDYHCNTIVILLFPTMMYVRPAKAQTSLCIRADWSEPLLVAWIFYEYQANDWASFEVSNLNRRLHRLVWVYSCQNAILLEITCRGSYAWLKEEIINMVAFWLYFLYVLVPILFGTNWKISEYCQIPLILLKIYMACKNIHRIAFNFTFCAKMAQNVMLNALR